MLEGIQILNETTIWSAGFGDIILGWVLCAVSVFLIILSILFSRDNEYGMSILFFILFFLFGTGAFFSFYDYNTRTSYQKYQVTISETVKMTKFNDRYKIISQDGKIFTIRDKIKMK